MDYPLEIAGAHGRIAAYRAALAEAEYALKRAAPYVGGWADAGTDFHPNLASGLWSKKEAANALYAIHAAIDIARAELAVTNP
jgi:hypothetical protein